MANLYKGIEGSPITYLAADISANQTTISIADDSALPDAPNIATIGYGEQLETIKYETKSNGVLQNVTRGIEGTPRAWPAGTEVARFFTAYDHNSIIENFNSHLAESAQQAHGENLELITSGTLSAAVVLSLSNIPQKYKHLKLIIDGKRNVSGSNIIDLGFRFNGISSESYYNQAIKAVGSTLTSERTKSTSTFGRLGQLEFVGRSIIEMTIYDYTSNSTKIVSSKYMVAGTNLSEHGEVSTLFTLNSPVNLIETNSYMASGAKYYLYGIRGE